MCGIRKRLVSFLLLLVVALAVPASPAAAEQTFNDEYVFAATRSVNDMDMNPALKVSLFPVTVVLDIAFLPFAVIVGFVTA